MFTHPRTALLFAAVAVFIFGLSVFHNFLLVNTDLFGAIYPSVLTDLSNRDRKEASIAVLAVSSELKKVAELKANDMATKGYFAHTSPEGLTPWYWFKVVGYQYEYAGENLAINFSDTDDVEKAWMNSPTHKANIINPRFTEIGIATAEGTYRGKKAVFVVQSFGTPQKNLGTDFFSNQKASVFEFWATNPGNILSFVYLLIALLVGVSVILLVFSEVSRGHVRSAVCSGIVLIIIITLFIVYREFFLGNLMIG